MEVKNGLRKEKSASEERFLRGNDKIALRSKSRRCIERRWRLGSDRKGRRTTRHSIARVDRNIEAKNDFDLRQKRQVNISLEFSFEVFMEVKNERIVIGGWETTLEENSRWKNEICLCDCNSESLEVLNGIEAPEAPGSRRHKRRRGMNDNSWSFLIIVISLAGCGMIY